MNVRGIFMQISAQLEAEFEKTKYIRHNTGKGTAREDAFHQFLHDYLPTRYTSAKGEVVSVDGHVSNQCDVVIYDATQCPRLLAADEHSIFPLECVYGVIEVKSDLTSERLVEAYANLASIRKMYRGGTFEYSYEPGMRVGMQRPVPVTAVVAYASTRSLDAIAHQVAELDRQARDIGHIPDYVVVLGVGIIGPRDRLRGPYNSFAPRQDPKASLTGRHTLLRFYMQFLDELNSIALEPVELGLYLRAPVLLGRHRVARHDQFVIRSDAGGMRGPLALTKEAIEKIYKYCEEVGPVTYGQHLINTIGGMPRGAEMLDLEALVFEYNPKKLPPMRLGSTHIDGAGRSSLDEPAFSPCPLEIDGRNYAVDLSALEDDDFEANELFTKDELFAC